MSPKKFRVMLTALMVIVAVQFIGTVALAGVSPTKMGTQRVKKALKVRGQTRNLKMVLMLKDKKDKVKFVKVRENYNKEIKSLNY